MLAVGAKAIPRLIIVLALVVLLVTAKNQVPAVVSAVDVPSSGVVLAPELVPFRAAVRGLSSPSSRAGSPGVPRVAARPATDRAKSVAKVPAKQISKRLDRFLAGRPGPVTAMVKELGTGRVYRYHAGERLITASTAKVQILMALLLRTPWKKLPAAVRRDAEKMIRYSDNHAADRLWLRIGGAAGFSAAGKKFGLRHTQGVPGNCVDLYCWGITKTSVDDQVRLMAALVSEKSPLKAGDRKQVLKLMGAVVAGQDWGISAAACRGERVALKNGWLKRVSNKLWATISVGLIRDGGRDYAVAVLTEGSPEVGYGIATVEGVAERIMRDFRRCQE